MYEPALFLEGVAGLGLCWFKSSHPHSTFYGSLIFYTLHGLLRNQQLPRNELFLGAYLQKVQSGGIGEKPMKDFL